jgi:hypothetical protein
MERGQLVKCSALEIGDYFTNDYHQKYRKIPTYQLELPNLPLLVLNTFHIQSNTDVFIDPDSEYIFLAHATWDPEKHKDQFILTIQEAELSHQIDYFTNYYEILNTSLQGIETSDNYFDEDSISSREVDEFTNLMRSSFFVSLYSYLESQLNNECRKSQQESAQIKVFLDDIHGSGINRAKTYLLKVLDTSFPFDSNPDWKQIQWFNKIRNCLVHNEGKVKDKDLKAYIDQHSDLYYEHFFGEDYIIFEDGFCESAISVIEHFLLSLLYHRQADRIS